MSLPNASLKIAIALLLIAAAALTGALGARHVESGITGPLAIAVDGDRVAVAAPGMLYRLDAAGHLQARIDSVIAPDARDAGLYWLGGDLLASPAVDGGTLLRCDDETCAPFSKDPYAPTGPVQSAAATPGRLWLAETDADRVHRFFEDGRRIDMPLSNLERPGSLWQDDVALYVANTDAGKLQRFDLHKRGVGAATDIAAFQAQDDTFDPPVLPLRLLPDGSGGFHVLLTNQSRTRGALASVSANGDIQQKNIPALINPISFAVSGDDFLIVDEDRMQVLRVSNVNPDAAATVFGDDDFNTALSAQHEKQALLRTLIPMLLVVATLLAAAGSWSLLRHFLHEETEPALAVKTSPDGIAWLPPDTQLIPRRLGRTLLMAAPWALFPALLAGFYHHAGAGKLWFFIVLLLATVPVWINALRSRIPDQLKIGLRDKQMVIEHATWGLREYWLTQINWNEKELQPEKDIVLPLQRNGVALFHLPTLRESLFPRLQVSRRKD